MIYSPEQSIEVYRELAKALGYPLDVVTHYKDESLNLLQIDIDFDITQFSRKQRVELLRINSILQMRLEQLSAIIELVPFNFRKNHINTV